MWLATDELICTSEGSDYVGKVDAEYKIMPACEIEFNNHMTILVGKESCDFFKPGKIFDIGRCRGIIRHRCAGMHGLVIFFGVLSNEGVELVLPKKYFDESAIQKVLSQMNECVGIYNVAVDMTEVEEAYIIAVPDEFIDDYALKPFTVVDLFAVYESHSLAAALLPMLLYMQHDGYNHVFELYNTEKTVKFVERLQKLLQHRFGVFSIKRGSSLSFNDASYQRLLARLEVGEKYPIFEQNIKVVNVKPASYSLMVKNVETNVINGVKIK